MKYLKRDILLPNLFIMFLFGIFAFWPISTDIRGEGIIKSANYIEMKALNNGYISDLNITTGSKVLRGQNILSLSAQGFSSTIVSPIDGEITFLNPKCQNGSYVIAGESIASVCDPNQLSVLCIFSRKYLQKLSEGRVIEVYPADNLYQLTKTVKINYKPYPLLGKSLIDSISQYEVNERSTDINVAKSFGVEGMLSTQNYWWNHYDGLRVKVILKGSIKPLIWIMWERFLKITSIIMNTFHSEPTAGIYLSLFSITWFFSLLSIFPGNFYYWPLAVLELNNQKEQKMRAKVPQDPPPVGVIIPGKNEVKTIVQTVKSTFVQNFPISKIVIIDDGSDDGMSDLLIKTFGLVDCSAEKKKLMQCRGLPTKGKIKQILKAEKNLFLIIKENAGKGYAINDGVNFCYDEKYLCLFDADTIPDPDGVLLLVFPMIENNKVQITSGRNQFINGCGVSEGIVTQPQIVKSFLLLSQIREFFCENIVKSFYNAIHAQLTLVGNFSCYNRDLIIKLNGFAERGLTEDYDFGIEAHQLKGSSSEVSIKAVVLARGWTQAPYTLNGLFHQRVRWAGGIFDSMIRYWKVLLRPKYGFVGMYALPESWISKLLFPINFFTTFLGIPISTFLFIFSPTLKALFSDLIFVFFVPQFILTFVIKVIVYNYLDWKFVRSYSSKGEYFYLTFYHFLTGWIFESICMICIGVGYWRTLLGYGSWGKVERTNLSSMG